MAKIYAPPAHLPPPPFDWKRSYEEYEKQCSAWVEQLRTLAKGQPRPAASDPDLIGEVVSFQVADSHAQYIVWATAPTLALIHLPLGDGYAIPDAHARGLSITDIRAMVLRERRIRELFAQKVPGGPKQDDLSAG